MIRALSHRGPDGEGIWSQGSAGLAHCRLAVIDLRAEANQPMSNEDDTVWVVFNGEIYNFQELRDELIAKGHRFRTKSDTEVIIHGYEEFGRGCLDRLRGMFAFAIWDVSTRTLLLARDRVGKKPLYYCVDNEQLLFASELKGILADGSAPRETDRIAIHQYLSLQYVPSPMTAFRGIRKLPAAHWLELRDGRVTTGRYWKLQYMPKQTLTFQDAVEELKHRLAEAVRMRLVSDVSIGAFLSGGVDSSAVVALMATQTAEPVRTFCVGFDQNAFDERPFARVIAERYGTKHTELLIKPQVAEILPKLVWHFDEPFGDSSAVPSYAIAEETRRHVTVALNGDGGDESFAGYDWYSKGRSVRVADRLPISIRRGLHQCLRSMPSSWRARPSLRKLVRVSEVLALEPARRHAQWMLHLTADERSALYTEEFALAVSGSDSEERFVEAWRDSDAQDGTDAMLDADVNLYLADDLLVKMDRATMAHALEARSPFLDHKLMEFVATLPSSFKLHGGERKHLLKTSLRGLVDDPLLDRPKKGFRVPLASWFRKELREMAYDVLLSPRCLERGYFSARGVRTLLDDHCAGRNDHGEGLWDLLVLEQWHRTFVDAPGFHVSGGRA
jgi:asparagine synthase (glutamine-hydrolysing)